MVPLWLREKPLADAVSNTGPIKLFTNPVLAGLSSVFFVAMWFIAAGAGGGDGIAVVVVFHAGTKRDGDFILAAGGRVLNVTAIGKTGVEALDKAYHGVAQIDWPQGFYRCDIGWRLRARGVE